MLGSRSGKGVHEGETVCAGRHGCARTDDVREALSALDPDGAIVCTQDHTHAGFIVQALEAGKRVYCEKPLCTHASARPWDTAGNDRMATLDQAVQAVLIGAAANTSIAEGGVPVRVQDLLAEGDSEID